MKRKAIQIAARACILLYGWLLKLARLSGMAAHRLLTKLEADGK